MFWGLSKLFCFPIFFLKISRFIFRHQRFSVDECDMIQLVLIEKAITLSSQAWLSMID